MTREEMIDEAVRFAIDTRLVDGIAYFRRTFALGYFPAEGSIFIDAVRDQFCRIEMGLIRRDVWVKTKKARDLLAKL